MYFNTSLAYKDVAPPESVRICIQIEGSALRVAFSGAQLFNLADFAIFYQLDAFQKQAIN